jgi:hypothetical protein
VGQSVTLTAIVSAADGSNPPGTVQFEVAGSDIGPAVQVTAGNLFSEAITSTTFDAPGTEALSAVFTPSSIAYSGSTGTLSLTSGPRQAGGVFISVTLPPSGALTVTVGAGSVTLTEQSTTATGTLNDVTVADTRNTYPGWSVSAQDTAFTGSGTAAGSTIPGDDLGWTPGGTVSGGATLGPMVVPGASPGLQDAAQVLASAAPGSGVGTDSLSAALTLDIPAATSAGPYTSSLTITYLLTGP